MVAFFKRGRDSIHVSFLEDILYLHPPSLADEPSHDPILRGQVTLVVAAPRRAKKVRVELIGRATRHAGDGGYAYESNQCLEKHLEIDLQGETLDKGTHTYVPFGLFPPPLSSPPPGRRYRALIPDFRLRRWDFSFILPSSTAVTERSDFGSIRHSGEYIAQLQKAAGAENDQKPCSAVRATLHGHGTFRDLTSSPKAVWLIANPAAPGDLPSGASFPAIFHTDRSPLTGTPCRPRNRRPARPARHRPHRAPHIVTAPDRGEPALPRYYPRTAARGFEDHERPGLCATTVRDPL